MNPGWSQRAFPGDACQLREVRRYVSELLDGCPYRDDVVYCVAELSSNAIKHTRSGNGGTFVVHLRSTSDSLAVAVADAGAATTPVVRPARNESLSEGGRGLEIVAGLSSRMGIDGDEQGRVVWAEFRQSTSPQADIKGAGGRSSALSRAYGLASAGRDHDGSVHGLDVLRTSPVRS